MDFISRETLIRFDRTFIFNRHAWNFERDFWPTYTDWFFSLFLDPNNLLKTGGPKLEENVYD